MTAARRLPLSLIELLALNAELNNNAQLPSDTSECLHIADNAALSLIDLTNGIKSIAAMAARFDAPYCCPVEKAAMQENATLLLSEVAAIAAEMAYLAQQAVDTVKDRLEEMADPAEPAEPTRHQWECEVAA